VHTWQSVEMIAGHTSYMGNALGHIVGVGVGG
jgi:hypothetical protein